MGGPSANFQPSCIGGSEGGRVSGPVRCESGEADRSPEVPVSCGPLLPRPHSPSARKFYQRGCLGWRVHGHGLWVWGEPLHLCIPHTASPLYLLRASLLENVRIKEAGGGRERPAIHILRLSRLPAGRLRDRLSLARPNATGAAPRAPAAGAGGPMLMWEHPGMQPYQRLPRLSPKHAWADQGTAAKP